MWVNVFDQATGAHPTNKLIFSVIVRCRGTHDLDMNFFTIWYFNLWQWGRASHLIPWLCFRQVFLVWFWFWKYLVIQINHRSPKKLFLALPSIKRLAAITMWWVEQWNHLIYNFALVKLRNVRKRLIDFYFLRVLVPYFLNFIFADSLFDQFRLLSLQFDQWCGVAVIIYPGGINGYCPFIKYGP